jgi:hypothetical protein
MPLHWKAGPRHGIPCELALMTLALERELKPDREIRFDCIAIEDEPAVHFAGADYLLPDQREFGLFDPVDFINGWIKATVKDAGRSELLLTFRELKGIDDDCTSDF